MKQEQGTQNQEETCLWTAKAMTSAIAHTMGPDLPPKMLEKSVTFAQPPYLLEKLPNLLCYNLFLPLVQTTTTNDENPKVVTATSIDTKTLSHVLIDPRIPTLTVSKNELGAGCNLNVYRAKPKHQDADIKNRDDFELVHYCVIPLDCHVDIDRSSLSMHGPDYLSARLPFSSASQAAVARMERSLVHPAPSELDPSWYARGICCHQCGTPLLKSNKVTKVSRAASTPWTELLQNVTCVAPEEYLGEGADPAFGIGHVAPKVGRCLIGDAVLAFHPDDIDQNAISIRKVKLGSDHNGLDAFQSSDDYRVSGPNMALRNVVRCKCCNSWVGDSSDFIAQSSSSNCCSDNHGKNEKKSEPKVSEIRLFKSCIACQPESRTITEVTATISLSDNKTAIADEWDPDDPFIKYTVDALIGSFMSDASRVRDCKRFLLSAVSSCDVEENTQLNPVPFAKLVLFSVDNWVQSHLRELRPKLKVLYHQVSQLNSEPLEGGEESSLDAKNTETCLPSEALEWACEQGAEIVVLEQHQCDEILKHLNEGNRLLPPSVRKFGGLCVGFLDW